MKTTKTADTTFTVTRTAKGRFSVRFVCPVTGKAKRRSFRTERLARIFVNGHTATAGYWANSAIASVCDDYAAGRARVIHVG